MRAHFALLVFLAFGGIGRAETLDSAKIEELLDDTTVYGLPLAPDSWRQSFSKGGETIYIDASGAKTFGSWLVRGNKYCSLWPPSDRCGLL